jgi:hypothetical protein
LYALLTQIFNLFSLLGGMLVGLGSPQTILIGELMIAIALGGQGAADYLKQQGIITLPMQVGPPWPVYAVLKLVFTIIAAVGGALINANYGPMSILAGQVLAAVAIGGQLAIDYLKQQNILSLHLSAK